MRDGKQLGRRHRRTMSERQRLEQKLSDARKRWERLSEKLRVLRKQSDLETRDDEKLRLEPQIADAENDRQAVEDEIRAPHETDAYTVHILGFVKQMGDIADGARSVVVFFCLAFVSIGLASDFRSLAQYLKGGKPLILYVFGQSFNLILTLFIAWLAFYVVFPDITAQI